MFRFGRYSFYLLLVDADADALGGHMPKNEKHDVGGKCLKVVLLGTFPFPGVPSGRKLFVQPWAHLARHVVLRCRNALVRVSGRPFFIW
jgi:hypothetical protein